MSDSASDAPEGPQPKRSRAGLRRALVLIAVHALIALHIGHWLATGSSISPLEPSESMEIATRGIVNAGLIFFVLTIASTAILGRWFCGWACHVVALQDLCRALMMKVGITPRPLRSRALLWVPLLAAGYMFVLPMVQRASAGLGLMPQATHLTTTTFWATFPTWPVALATFVTCGFVAVFLLGSKGFCTYGCPYGAIFGLVDQVAPGRIRVNDDCNSCGHCTAVCSSNVIVHREVAEYGMVVDPGCMKCLDCVSVCPTEALRFGFGAPALRAKPREGVTPTVSKPALTWGEEALLAVAFALAFFAFRGIYGVVPFLFALGLAGSLAFVALLATRLVRRPAVKLLRWHLKQTGKLTRLGVAFVVMTALAAGLWVHSGLIQVRGWRAAALHEETTAIAPSWIEQLLRPRKVEGEQRALLEAALGHARFVQRWGLLPDTRNDLRLAWFHLLDRDDARVEAAIKRVLVALPDAAPVRFDYANYLVQRERPEEAVALYERVIELQPTDARGARQNLFKLHARAARWDAAAATLEAAIAAHPKVASLRVDLGNVEAQRGRAAAAHTRFLEALALDLRAPRAPLYTAMEGQLRAEQAQEALRQADALVAIDPGDAVAHRVAGRALIMLKDYEGAEARLQRSRALAPHPMTLSLLAALAKQRGDMQAAVELQREAQRLGGGK